MKSINVFFLVFFVYLFSTGQFLTFVNFAFQGAPSSSGNISGSINQQTGLAPLPALKPLTPLSSNNQSLGISGGIP